MQQKKRAQGAAMRAGAIIVWLLVWQFAAMAVNRKIFLVSPVDTAQALAALLQKGTFYISLAGSLGRIFAGFLMAVLLGSALAVAGKRFGFVRTLLAPVMSVIKATPVASFVILALIWISSANLSVFISFLMVLPIAYTNVSDGLDQADGKLLQVARVFRMKRSSTVRAVYIPAVMPAFLTSIRLSLGLCWKAGIAAEVIGQPKNSIGSSLHQAKVFFDTPELFAWTVSIIVISVLMEKAVLRLVESIAQKYR